MLLLSVSGLDPHTPHATIELAGVGSDLLALSKLHPLSLIVFLTYWFMHAAFAQGEILLGQSVAWFMDQLSVDYLVHDSVSSTSCFNNMLGVLHFDAIPRLSRRSFMC